MAKIEYPMKEKVLSALKEGCRDKQEHIKCALQEKSLQEYWTELMAQHSMTANNKLFESVYSALQLVLLKIQDELPKFDHRLQGYFISIGSFHDGTKVSPPNEFDFHYLLTDQRYLEDFTPDSMKPNCPLYLLCRKDSPKNAYWIDLLEELPQAYNYEETAEEKYYADNFLHIGTAELRWRFGRILTDILKYMELPDGLKHGGFATPLFSGVDINGPACALMFKWHNLFDISVDVSIALPLHSNLFEKMIQEMSPTAVTNLFSLLDPDFCSKNVYLITAGKQGEGWELATSQIEQELLKELDKTYNISENVMLLKIINEMFLKIQYKWGYPLTELVTQMKNKILSSQNPFRLFRIMECTSMSSTRETIDFASFFIALNYLVHERKEFEPLKFVCSRYLVPKKVAFPPFSFYHITPDSKQHLHELVSPDLTIRSCIFKYIIFNLFLEGNVTLFPPATENGPNFHFIKCILQNCFEKDAHRHFLLLKDINKLEMNFGYYELGSSDLHALRQVHIEHCQNIFAHMFPENPGRK